MNALSALAITEVDLQKYIGDAQAYLDMARQTFSANAGRTSGTYLAGQTTSDQVSFSKLVSSMNVDDPLLTDVRLHTLRAVRRGMQIGFHVADQYRQRSGAASFDSAHGLSDAQKTELNEKMQTAAAIALFTAARYVLWNMQEQMNNNAFVGNIPASYEMFELSTPRSATMSMMYMLGKHVDREVQGSDDRLVAAVVGFMQVVEEAISNRVTGLKHIDPFTSVSYTLENTDFSVHGFDTAAFLKASSIEFKRVAMSDIVGNADAKHYARRLVERTMCYNVLAKRNVFSELGGLAPVWMGYGKPGTGKSMLIAAVATAFQEYCERLGRPFLFHPLPDNIIDSYQGNSAKNMVAWMKMAQDPSQIVFMPIDDAENILEERTRQGVSEGVRAAIGVFLRYTEGAYAVNHGNATIGVFTNLPEQLDAAVRSRILGRMVINGAATVEDFFDPDHLWMRRFAGQEFLDVTPPDQYQYMSAQQAVKSIGDTAQTRDEPENAIVAELFAAVAKKYPAQSHEFIGHLYQAFMERFPQFSSRDIRNIQSAIDQRVMDFDLPPEWFEKPENFVDLEYDRQKVMVLALRDENLKGLRLAGVYRQEAVRYLDNYVAIANAQFDRDVEERVKQMHVAREVERRMSPRT